MDDEVLVSENDELTPAKVVNVSSVQMQGNNYYLFTFIFDIDL